MWTFICVSNIIFFFDTHSIGSILELVGAICIPWALYIGAKVSNAKSKAKAVENEERKLQELREGRLPVINIPNLFLGNAQLRFYQMVTISMSENQLVGFNSISKGRSREIWDGSYKTRSNTTSEAVYGKVTSKYTGQLAITDNSIIFINDEKGFEIKIAEVALLTAYADGVGIQSRDYSFTILLREPRYFVTLIKCIQNNNLNARNMYGSFY